MTQFLAPSQHPGMGAVIHGEWCSFRVWAPYADGVSVGGTFNDWASDDVKLKHEGGGYWSADVLHVKAGDGYKYFIGDSAFCDPYAIERALGGESVVCVDDFQWDEAPFWMPPWNEIVVYELHAGTFNDVPGGEPGTFDSVINRLPHLQSLGINAIELMPCAEFAGDFSWGYNPGAPFAVEHVYGGHRALKRLIRAAHRLGIAIIYDVVYNHIGPQDSILWRFGGWGPPGCGGAYYYNDFRAATRWGEQSRPDYGRPEVRQYFVDNAMMWLETFRFDGLRLDSTSYIRNVYGRTDDPDADLPDGWRLMQQINAEVRRRQPWKITIAEDLCGTQRIINDVENGGAGFNTQWDGGFCGTLRDMLIEVFDGSRSMTQLARIIDEDSSNWLGRVIYTESHDEDANGHTRLPQAISQDAPGDWFARKRSTLGAAIVLTSPGIPMLFQGQEFLEDEYFRDSDPLDWSKAERFAGILAMYRDLIHLRQDRRGNTAGLCGPHTRVHHVDEQAKLIAYLRWDGGGPGDEVVVIANFANAAHDSCRVGVPRSGTWRVRFNGDATVYSPDFAGTPALDAEAENVGRDDLPFSVRVPIGPYSALILSQDR